MARFFKEMTALFPDQYVHIGGDENNGVQWRNNPRIQAFMRQHNIKTVADLQTYFERKLTKIVTRDGKKVIGWDEILQPGVPQNAVIQSWRGKQSLYKAARKGHPAILSKDYYLNLLHSAAHYYKNDPIPPNSDLAPKVKKNILGGEAAVWG
jgi:hexosaminidase